MKQNYPLDIIASLFHEYFPEKEILQYSLCEGGVENSNFLIETEQEKYILKVFESSRHDEELIRSEVGIMIETKNSGSPIPQIFLTKNDENVIAWPEWKLTILMEYISGDKYRDGPLNLELIFILWKNIAQFQSSLRELTGRYFAPERHKFDIRYIFEHTELHDIVPDYADPSLLKSVWDDLKKIQSILFSLPRQIIHNDLHTNNIIFRDRDPHFVDFSDMVVGNCIQDTAVSLTSWCFHHHWYPEWMTEFLRWFQTVRELSYHEKECLFACIEARMLNILMIPYLDAGIGEYEELKEDIFEYYASLKRLHEFGKEKFMKYIP